MPIVQASVKDVPVVKVTVVIVGRIHETILCGHTHNISGVGTQPSEHVGQCAIEYLGDSYSPSLTGLLSIAKNEVINKSSWAL